MNKLKRPERTGQSVWFGHIRRDLPSGGELRTVIIEGGPKGPASNPAIFEKGQEAARGEVAHAC